MKELREATMEERRTKRRAKKQRPAMKVSGVGTKKLAARLTLRKSQDQP